MNPHDNFAGWLAKCQAFAREHNIDARDIQVLHAFNCAQYATADRSENETPEFPALESVVESTIRTLAMSIPPVLIGEIDRDQAEVFGRRFQSVSKLLKEQAKTSAAARIWRVGLACRMS